MSRWLVQSQLTRARMRCMATELQNAGQAKQLTENSESSDISSLLAVGNDSVAASSCCFCCTCCWAEILFCSGALVCSGALFCSAVVFWRVGGLSVLLVPLGSMVSFLFLPAIQQIYLRRLARLSLGIVNFKRMWGNDSEVWLEHVTFYMSWCSQTHWRWEWPLGNFDLVPCAWCTIMFYRFDVQDTPEYSPLFGSRSLFCPGCLAIATHFLSSLFISSLCFEYHSPCAYKSVWVSSSGYRQHFKWDSDFSWHCL